MHSTPLHPGLSRPSALPWYAAATSLGVGLVPFLVTVAVQWPRSLPDDQALWFSYASFVANLVFRTGVAFLIAQWYGERHDCLAFRRPAAVLAIFALGLLCWLAVQMGVTTGLLHLLTGSIPLSIASALLSLLHPLIQALGVWLSWLAAATLMRKDALPFPPSRVRLRTAGLVAWTVASAQATFLPISLAMIAAYTRESYVLAAAISAVAMVPPMAAAFAGAWMGLPRDLTRIHGGRLLAVTIVAAGSTALVLWGLLLGMSRLLSPDIRTSPLPATGLAVLALAVGMGAYYVWTVALYLGVTQRAAA